MRPEKLKQILEEIQIGKMSVDDAMESLAQLPFTDIGSAVVDHHRALRTGFPEVVLGDQKTPSQIASIVKELATTGGNVLVTRVDETKAQTVCSMVAKLKYHNEARILSLKQIEIKQVGIGQIVIVTAGTSDLPVAAEAALVAKFAGNSVLQINDVGVAGVHRLLHRLSDLRKASVIIVVAGMEGALPSVIGGLVSCPIIAVPTSVGYGVSFGGVTALLGMLSSCSAGITVVNIDNGFGAGYAASLINKTRTN